MSAFWRKEYMRTLDFRSAPDRSVRTKSDRGALVRYSLANRRSADEKSHSSASASVKSACGNAQPRKHACFILAVVKSASSNRQPSTKAIRSKTAPANLGFDALDWMKDVLVSRALEKS